MNFSSEKSKDSVPTASLRKNPSVGILITFCILKNATSRILERCNRMTYRVTDRQQTTIWVPIRSNYRYFAACQHVSGSSVIQVCVRYGVHGCFKPLGTGWTEICWNIIRQPFPHVWMRDWLNARLNTWGIGYMTDLPVGYPSPSDKGGVTGWHTVSQTVSRPPWLCQSGKFIVILSHVSMCPAVQSSRCASGTGCMVALNRPVTGERGYAWT